ncbi:MAG: hypothetical protein JL50_05355 [Peptococcaceae bacterium BICA1-7]|jgi:hypothetical protein|nr:MAG: hypothetical protein JL50_05355 [Peptococcaceae bacterium BICA1-7]HBV96038.1 hypothetical protein [Desulfotomaculum sp.]
MVSTGDMAELKSCINNAQNVVMEMGPIIDRVGSREEKDRLKELSGKIGTLLEEASQRTRVI